MMRNRLFLIGLGTGLIIGALLLQLMNLAQTQPQMLNTEAEVREAAQSLGLKVYDSSQQVYTEQEWKEREAGGSAQPSAQQESASPPSTPEAPSSPVKPSDAAEPSEASEPTEAAEPSTATIAQPSAAAVKEPASSPAPDETVKVKITSGSNLTAVAAKLKAAGVISDQAGFIQQAKEWNASRKIQTGTFTFIKGESFKSITEKITTKIK